MIAPLKSTLLLSLLAGTAILPQSQEQSDRASTQAANRIAAGLPQPTASPAIASALAEWRALRQTDALPFDSYAGFTQRHPGWPGEAANRRAAERQAANAAPANVVAFFRRYPPLTATGTVVLTPAQLSMLLEGIDWRRPERTFTPMLAG